MEEIIDTATIVMMVRHATREVLSTMLDLETDSAEPYAESIPPPNSEGVVSFVGLTGERWAGTGCLRSSSVSACHLASRFLMAEYDSVNDDVLDAFAELTNMIIGNLKNDIEQRLGPTGLSIPTVIHGKNFSTRSLKREEWIVVPFHCGTDLLEIRMCLQQRESNTPIVRYGERQEFILSA
jgi:chemotaxis protein CheX